jgi:agmatinase
MNHHLDNQRSNKSSFDPNAVSHPRHNIFGLPFNEEQAKVVILPVPWEVTATYDTRTARASNNILKESHKIELLDPAVKDGWKAGFYMRDCDKKVLLKSDYLRKEAELFINYVSEGENPADNKFMTKTLLEINEGSEFLKDWVYKQTKALINNGKLVGLLGGDHSIGLGFLKALSETAGDFGILHIDAHCDLRKSYMDFVYSHASIMYNVMEEIPQVTKLVQLGIRDYCNEEQDYIEANPHRITPFYDKDIKERMFEGQTWQNIVTDVVNALPEKVYISIDIDGLDPKLCPHTCSPVVGGIDADQLFYLLKTIVASGKKLIGFDLTEIGMSHEGFDENVGARILFRLCNAMVAANC